MVRLRENGPFHVRENGLFYQNGLFFGPFQNGLSFTTGPSTIKVKSSSFPQFLQRTHPEVRNVIRRLRATHVPLRRANLWFGAGRGHQETSHNSRISDRFDLAQRIQGKLQSDGRISIQKKSDVVTLLWNCISVTIQQRNCLNTNKLFEYLKILQCRFV